MMRFGPREIVFLLVLASMPAAAYFLVFQPRARETAEAHTEVARMEQKLRQLEAQTASIDSLADEIAKLQGAIDLFERKLPEQQQVEVILKEVWELAARHELTPKSVRTDKIVPAADYAELPIKMTITGDFDGFYAFLLELERLPRITRMPTMRLRKLDDGNGQMQADLVLSIFFDGKA